MFKKVEKQILDFVKKYPEIDRYEMVHGTLYVKFIVIVICYPQELYLGNNKINSLNGESFSYITSLSIFDFRDNRINM